MAYYGKLFEEYMKKESGSVSPKAMIIGLSGIVIVLALLLICSVKKGAPEASEGMQTSLKSFTALNWTPDSADYKRAEKSIATLGEGQNIEFSTIADPANPDTVYFSTSTPLPLGDAPKTSNLVSIYKYNLKTYAFERLYRKEYTPGSFPGLTKDVGDKSQGVSYFITPVVHVIGYDSGKLVLYAMDASDSPGPCWTPLASGHESGPMRATVSMDLEKPYNGFTPYTPPESALAQAEDDYQACISELFPG